MLIQCLTHGETEAYESRGYAFKCKLCHRAHTQNRRRRQASGELTARKYAVEAVVHVVHAPKDLWLTCNQPGCGLVCADVHELYLHKRGQHPIFGTPEPEPVSLLQSSLRDA